MKRVLIWGMTENWGGIESILYNYVIYSDKSNVKYDIITTCEYVPREEELNKNGSKVVHINNRKSNYIAYRKQLIKFMKDNAKTYDAVWLNDCMFANIDILKLAKKFGISKRIIHAHNANSLGGGNSRLIRHKINTWLLPRFATDYWACSQLAGEWSYTKKILGGKNYKVIPNAIDCSKYSYSVDKRKLCRERLQIDKDTIVVGHIGRFDYQKNHHYLLKVFSELVKKHPDSKLLSVGTGTDWEEIKKEAFSLGLTNRIMFLGQRDDIADLLQAMDVFVLPSKFEGLPVVLVEAMAAGLPCVISDKVTKETAIISDLSYFESIESEPANWVNTIIHAYTTCKRKDTYIQMVQAGFDINTQAKKLYELF